MASIAQLPQAPPRHRPRFHLGRFDGHEELRIQAAWPGLKCVAGLLVMLPVWVAAASLKFGAKIFYSGWQGIVLVVVITTFAFVAYVVLQIVWWLLGAERIAVIGEDLLVRHTMLGVPLVTRSYRGRDIRFLGAMDVPGRGWLDEPLLPFAASGRCGSVKFFYREATIYLAHDLGLADGKAVAAWLSQRLPAAAAVR